MIAPRFSEHIYLRVAPRDTALFRFLLEAHDNLAYFTMLDRREGVLRLVFAPGSINHVLDVLDSMKECLEITCLEIGPQAAFLKASEAPAQTPVSEADPVLP